MFYFIQGVKHGIRLEANELEITIEFHHGPLCFLSNSVVGNVYEWIKLDFHVKSGYYALMDSLSICIYIEGII